MKKSCLEAKVHTRLSKQIRKIDLKKTIITSIIILFVPNRAQLWKIYWSLKLLNVTVGSFDELVMSEAESIRYSCWLKMVVFETSLVLWAVALAFSLTMPRILSDSRIMEVIAALFRRWLQIWKLVVGRLDYCKIHHGIVFTWKMLIFLL